ncbi:MULTISPECIES: hypothetical protein [unclassified Methylobacterium]|jgi:N-acetylglucosamine kinase-like BadF-type ATPase|uniref:hypothetical protein n=1 Tax=unclassified Methylobacterium TaxID=2615210 RepID=UPI0006F7A048|nr:MULTISPECIES: hypothetical protein [unclassified Methylobacterium]KQO56111.1 hypothetical protein ASF24_19430 [Methylobacterium sp. Leaf86]KQO96066.1 hypothetical protein ASF32_17380 [Methylobacterium sp. Leaf91]MBO1019558.1 hypothetical protein [Methylobacterium sp. SD274]
MNIAAILALQSIPFAALVLATAGANRDLFAVLYVAALGLTLSIIIFGDGYHALPLMPGVSGGNHR